ncbi:ATP-binding protein [Streptomyces sp. NPDC057909]|uniref:ATP-binding protein n=1 Tax=Streptomyces sp. NPDC057909 TaxID=3346277 RepID=UPI0036ED3364
MYDTAYDSPTKHTGGGAAAGWRARLSVIDGGDHPVPAPRNPATDPDDVTQELEHRPEAASAARHTARVALESWHVSRYAADAVLLVVSELVTNAVEHAEPPLALHMHREHTGSWVWVGVTDGGLAAHDGAWTSSCDDDEHGRGLDIVDALTDAHGTRTHPRGATYWARLTAA